MNIILKNTRFYQYICLCFSTGIMSAILFLVDPSDMFKNNPLGFYFTRLFLFIIFFMSIKALSHLCMSISIFPDSISVKVWKFFSVKEIMITKNEISKIEVTYNLFKKSSMNLLLVDGKKMEIDLNYINDVSKELRPIELSQYAPTDPNLKFTLKVAIHMSNQFDVPFSSEYIMK